MDIALLRARLGGAAAAAGEAVPVMPDAPAEAVAAPLSDDTLDLPRAALVPAAVLVPVLTGPSPAVLLTRRTEHLTKHPGQVAFPGGRIDPEDADEEAAALREAREEIGLDPSDVEVLGRLPDYVTGTGFRVTPVLGLLPPEPALSLSSHEVAAVFQLPLSVVLDPGAPQKRRAEFRGRMREFWVWPHPDHYIWGATAGILVHLARRLRGET